MQAANRRSAPIESAGYTEMLRRAARIEERIDDGAADETGEHEPVTADERATVLARRAR